MSACPDVQYLFGVASALSMRFALVGERDRTLCAPLTAGVPASAGTGTHELWQMRISTPNPERRIGHESRDTRAERTHRAIHGLIRGGAELAPAWARGPGILRVPNEPNGLLTQTPYSSGI